MGAKRVSDTIRLKNLLLKGTARSRASQSQQMIYFINLAPLLCRQIIHEEPLIFLNLFANMKRAGRRHTRAQLGTAARRGRSNQTPLLPPSHTGPMPGTLWRAPATGPPASKTTDNSCSQEIGLSFWGKRFLHAPCAANLHGFTSAGASPVHSP